MVKLRGTEYLGGYHDYIIKFGGLEVFPRMTSADHQNKLVDKQFSSDIKELDQLLGGGLHAGTSTLFLGPAGTGKSTLSLQYAYAAAERGEKAIIFAFEENLSTLIMRSKVIGMDVEKHLESGMMKIIKVDPAQLSPGEFADNVKNAVLSGGFKVVSIDSLNGYLHAMPEEQFLTLQLHELLAFLSGQGVLTLLVLAQHGMLGHMMNTPVDLTYLADTVIITRYFELSGMVKKAVSVIKQRSGLHESTIREFQITAEGIKVGEPLTKFKGVLTGVPSFTGEEHEAL